MPQRVHTQHDANMMRTTNHAPHVCVAVVVTAWLYTHWNVQRMLARSAVPIDRAITAVRALHTARQSPHPPIATIAPSSRGIVLALRGHVRDAFDTGELRAFADQLSALAGGSFRVCAHTWATHSSGTSWRAVAPDDRLVDAGAIRAYFGNLLVASVQIEHNTALTARGIPPEARVSVSQMPLSGWCSYWESCSRALALSRLAGAARRGDLVVTCRYDAFTHPIARETKIDVARAIAMVAHACKTPRERPTFLYDEFVLGFDNLYAGDMDSLERIARAFLGPAAIRAREAEFPLTTFQEELVYYYTTAAWPREEAV